MFRIAVYDQIVPILDFLYEPINYAPMFVH